MTSETETAQEENVPDPEHHPTSFPWKEAAVILSSMVLSAIVTVTIAVRIVQSANLIPRSRFETNRADSRTMNSATPSTGTPTEGQPSKAPPDNPRSVDTSQSDPAEQALPQGERP